MKNIDVTKISDVTGLKLSVVYAKLGMIKEAFDLVSSPREALLVAGCFHHASRNYKSAIELCFKLLTPDSEWEKIFRYHINLSGTSYGERFLKLWIENAMTFEDMDAIRYFAERHKYKHLLANLFAKWITLVVTHEQAKWLYEIIPSRSKKRQVLLRRWCDVVENLTEVKELYKLIPSKSKVKTKALSAWNRLVLEGIRKSDGNFNTLSKMKHKIMNGMTSEKQYFIACIASASSLKDYYGLYRSLWGINNYPDIETQLHELILSQVKKELQKNLTLDDYYDLEDFVPSSSKGMELLKKDATSLLVKKISEAKSYDEMMKLQKFVSWFSLNQVQKADFEFKLMELAIEKMKKCRHLSDIQKIYNDLRRCVYGDVLFRNITELYTR